MPFSPSKRIEDEGFSCLSTVSQEIESESEEIRSGCAAGHAMQLMQACASSLDMDELNFCSASVEAQPAAQ